MWNNIEILRKNLAHTYKDVTDFGDFSEEANEIVKRNPKIMETPISEVVRSSAYFLANKLKRKC